MSKPTITILQAVGVKALYVNNELVLRTFNGDFDLPTVLKRLGYDVQFTGLDQDWFESNGDVPYELPLQVVADE